MTAAVTCGSGNSHWSLLRRRGLPLRKAVGPAMGLLHSLPAILHAETEEPVVGFEAQHGRLGMWR